VSSGEIRRATGVTPARSGLLLTALACLGILLSAAPALAATAPFRPLLFSFDGADSSAGSFSGPRDVAVDYATGSVYVLDPIGGGGGGTICKFDAEGVAQDFSGPADSCLYETKETEPPFNPIPFNFGGASGIGKPEIAVDNSGANQGRIHVFDEKPNRLGPLHAFGPDGSFLWTIEPSTFEAFGFENCGLAIGPDGSPWVGVLPGEQGYLLRFATTGAPPAVAGEPVEVDGGRKCSRFDFNAGGDFYLSNIEGLDKYEGDEKIDFDPRNANDIAVNRSTELPTPASAGHIFFTRVSEFIELDASGAEVGAFGENDLVCPPDTFGCAHKGIAYNPSLDRVYVSDLVSKAVKVFGPPISITVPDVAIAPVTGIGATTATFHGTVNPRSVDNSWYFEWKKASQPSWAEAESSPPQSISPPDESDHPVEFEATGRTPATIYNVRLVGENTDFDVKAYSAVESFSDIVANAMTRPAAPRTDTTARLNAILAPAGNRTTYRFEYSRDGVDWTVLPDQVEPGSVAPLVVSEELSGLQPDTTYLFRFTAENALGPASVQAEVDSFTTRPAQPIETCPNEGVRQKQHTDAYLPDCRGIELVNRPDKGNLNVALGSPSPDGDRAIWNGGSGPNASGNDFLARRTGPSAAAPSGWQSASLVPPAAQQLGGGGGLYRTQVTTPDDAWFISSAQPTGESPEEALVRLDSDQGQEVLATYPEGIGFFVPVDLTDDGRHVVVARPETGQLEDIGGGEPEVLSIMPDGTPSECGLENEGRGFRGPNGGNISFGGQPVPGAAIHDGPGYHMIATTDASRVYFQVKPNGDCGASALLGIYVRNREAGTTTMIDGGEGSTPEFIRATPDGRRAYFVTRSALDPADANGAGDVYRWDEGAEASTCLTCAVENEAGEAIGDVGLRFHPGDGRFANVMVSADFSHVYFESEARLAAAATPGHSSLYALSEGEVHFVADTDSAETDVLAAALGASLSADGNVLLFDTRPDPGLTSDEFAPGVESALYLYDDRDGSLECVSCRRGGTTQRGEGGGNFGLSADGSTLAFVTAQALVAADVNGGSDVYRWREGSQALITDGERNFPVFEGLLFVWALDADGSDIFFTAVAPGLTGFEEDRLANAYDARVGGGLPPPTAPAHCTEDSCQGPLQAAPPLDQPGTAVLRGLGNVSGPPNCRRPGRQASRLRNRAKRLRRDASRANAVNRVRRMRRQAARLARRADRIGKRARRCRRANRGAAR